MLCRAVLCVASAAGSSFVANWLLIMAGARQLPARHAGQPPAHPPRLAALTPPAVPAAPGCARCRRWRRTGGAGRPFGMCWMQSLTSSRQAREQRVQLAEEGESRGQREAAQSCMHGSCVAAAGHALPAANLAPAAHSFLIPSCRRLPACLPARPPARLPACLLERRLPSL